MKTVSSLQEAPVIFVPFSSWAPVIFAGHHPKNKALEWWRPLAEQTFPGEALEISKVQ